MDASPASALDQVQSLARVGSWELDLATGEFRISPHLAVMLGLDPDRHTLTHAERIALRHPDDAARIDKLLVAARNGDSARYEARYRPADGSAEFLAAIVAELEHDPHGAPMLLRGSLQDITQTRDLEEQAKQAAVQAEAAEREHRIADELQAALLPPARFDSEHLQVLGYYRAGVTGTRVGGDWYDVIDLGGGRTALTVGDVMGRGVRAAALMGQVRSIVRSFAHLHLPPAELLARADELVADLAPDGCIVTCLYAVHDPATGRISFANAGHMPPLLCRPDGAVQVLDVPAATPLGTGYCAPTEHRVPVNAGDTLAL